MTFSQTVFAVVAAASGGMFLGLVMSMNGPDASREVAAQAHRQLVLQSCMDTGRSLFLCEAILAGKISPSEKGL